MKPAALTAVVVSRHRGPGTHFPDALVEPLCRTIRPDSSEQNKKRHKVIVRADESEGPVADVRSDRGEPERTPDRDEERAATLRTAGHDDADAEQHGECDRQNPGVTRAEKLRQPRHIRAGERPCDEPTQAIPHEGDLVRDAAVWHKVRVPEIALGEGILRDDEELQVRKYENSCSNGRQRLRWEGTRPQSSRHIEEKNRGRNEDRGRAERAGQHNSAVENVDPRTAPIGAASCPPQPRGKARSQRQRQRRSRTRKAVLRTERACRSTRRSAQQRRPQPTASNAWRGASKVRSPAKRTPPAGFAVRAPCSQTTTPKFARENTNRLETEHRRP